MKNKVFFKTSLCIFLVFFCGILYPQITPTPNWALIFKINPTGLNESSSTAKFVDMEVRTLQQLTITSRTIPGDLSRYPNWGFVVNIKTNVKSDWATVIKGGLN
jgi:hypothetical protein